MICFGCIRNIDPADEVELGAALRSRTERSAKVDTGVPDSFIS